MNPYENTDEHQPVTWVKGYPVYAAHLVVLGYVVSLFATTLLLALKLEAWLGWLTFESAAVLRGDVAQIVLGAQSNVQDGAVVHVADDLPAIIGRLVTVGHKAIVHACTVEDEVLVGMGAIILDGARVGTRSIIGANATVKQGMEIPPGSLVLGTPAKIVRTLSAEEQDEIKVWALRYVRLSREYLKVRG